VTSAEIEYRETRPGTLFRNYSLSLEGERQLNFGGDLQEAQLRSELDATWNNFWSTDFSVDVNFPAQDLRLTRGGPSMATPRGWSTGLRVSNSNAANTRGNARLQYRENENGGFAFEVNAGLTFRPAPRWQLSLQPGYERRVDDRQYVTALAGGSAETYGRRYVFAFVDRNTVSSEIRLNYTFKPDLNLEFYGEPFAASGRYYDFGELLAPGGLALRGYGTQGTALAVQPDGSLAVTDGSSAFTLRNLDFNVLSFRSNVVLRWEWRPGSTLYFVWQQDREERDTGANRVGVRDLFGSFATPGNNVIAVKTTFWFDVN
jgi:hypothetical protein